jgi:hypothetical protein
MSAEPFAWNIVIAGAWNVAILTPDGIRKRLFELPSGTPVEVEVSIDRPGLLRVIHDSLVVTPTSQALEVAPQKLEAVALQRAAEVAQRALRSLPETPTSAAGVNIRYQFPALPDGLLELLRAPTDDVFSDADYVIEGSLTKRSLTLSPGVINVEINSGRSGDGAVTMNFHRASDAHSDLATWLSRTQEFVELSQKLFRSIEADVQNTGGSP